jgi:hypothetical protein
MDIEKLNLKKVLAVASIVGGLITTIYLSNTGTGLLWSLVAEFDLILGKRSLDESGSLTPEYKAKVFDALTTLQTYCG